MELIDHQPLFVLDSSALLTMIREAPGGSMVGAQLGKSAISTVCWAEVLKFAEKQEVPTEDLRHDLEAVGLKIFPFTSEDADTTAEFRDPSHELSLSCRACLALAKRLQLPVLTADQTWQEIEVGLEIQLIR